MDRKTDPNYEDYQRRLQDIERQQQELKDRESLEEEREKRRNGR
jgi:hypothetical protein